MRATTRDRPYYARIMSSVESFMTDDEAKTYTRRNSLRLPTFDYATPAVYFVTIVAIDRRTLFYNQALASSVIECLLEQRERLNFNLYAYCLMPDHLHLLIGLKPDSKPLGQIIGAFKSLSTRRYWESGKGVLWQRQFHDHIIRNEKDFFETFEYIKQNPVKKKLVAQWDEWKYTGIIDTVG
jgi:putative transposase